MLIGVLSCQLCAQGGAPSPGAYTRRAMAGEGNYNYQQVALDAHQGSPDARGGCGSTLGRSGWTCERLWPRGSWWVEDVVVLIVLKEGILEVEIWNRSNPAKVGASKLRGSMGISELLLPLLYDKRFALQRDSTDCHRPRIKQYLCMHNTAGDQGCVTSP